MKNQLILITFALFCICAINTLMGNEDFKKVIEKLCDKQNKVSEEQWIKLMSCKNFSQRAQQESPNYEKIKTAFNDCLKNSDDVEDLKIANNDKQIRVVTMMCSQKFKVCMKDAWSSVKNTVDMSKIEERKAQLAQSLKCAKNVLGID